MKKLILILLLAEGGTSNAQNGLFIQPTVGLGLTALSTYQGEHFYTGITDDKAKFTFNPQLLLGYQYHHFVFSTGIGYMKEGYAGTLYQDPFYDNRRIEYFYTNYFTVPFVLGYKIDLSSRLSVTPALAYELGLRQQTETTITYDTASLLSSYRAPYTITEKKHASGTEGFASVKIDGIYKINPQLNIVAGLQARYRLATGNTDFFRSYTYTLNMGVQYFFKGTKINTAVKK